LISDEALNAIGNGYVGRFMECECGALEYVSDRRWLLTSLNGELERAYYQCDKCKSSKTPLDEQLAIEGNHQSIGVRRRIALSGMTQSLAEAEKLLAEAGISVSSKEIQLESEEVVKKIEDNITYFENNRGRMHYDEYKAKGYHIGSGTAESACSRAAIKAVRNDMVIGRSRSDPSVTDTLEKQRMG